MANNSVQEQGHMQSINSTLVPMFMHSTPAIANTDRFLSMGASSRPAEKLTRILIKMAPICTL